MIDNDQLAITATAYYLKDLNTALSKVKNKSGLCNDELVAIQVWQGVQNSIKDSSSAVGSFKDAGGARAAGATSRWNSIF